MKTTQIIMMTVVFGLRTSLVGGPVSTFYNPPVDGTNYVQKITEKDYVHFLTWDPEAEPCHTPLIEALTLARGKLKSTFPEATWNLKHIVLKEFLKKNQWYYEITFQRKGKESVLTDSFLVLVSPSGWIPELEVAKDNMPWDKRPWDAKPRDSEQEAASDQK